MHPMLFVLALAASPTPGEYLTPLLQAPATSSLDRPDTGDTAWDAETGRFCVTWMREFPDLRTFVHAQIFEADGSPASPLLWLGMTKPDAAIPAICNVKGQGAFVIVHGERLGTIDRLKVSAISATDHTIGQITIPTHRNTTNVDVGADPEIDQAYVVWSDIDHVHGQLVALPSLEDMFLVDEPSDLHGFFTGFGTEIYSREPYFRPRISATNGAAGNWLIAWEARQWIGDPTHPGDPIIQTRAVHRDGRLSRVEQLNTETLSAPAVAGDGTEFIVVARYISAADGRSRMSGWLWAVEGSELIDVSRRHVVMVQYPNGNLYEPDVVWSQVEGQPAYTTSWHFELDAAPGRRSAFVSFETRESFMAFGSILGVASDIRSTRLASTRESDPGASEDLVSLMVGRTTGMFMSVAVP